MFCPSCRKEISEADNFCGNCGFSLKEETGSPLAQSRIDEFKQACEIGWEPVDTDLKIILTTFGITTAKNKFVAKGLGLEGVTTIAESPIFICKHMPKEEGEALAAINLLIGLLIADGWSQSSIPKQYWWNYHFERRVHMKKGKEIV